MIMALHCVFVLPKVCMCSADNVQNLPLDLVEGEFVVGRRSGLFRDRPVDAQRLGTDFHSCAGTSRDHAICLLQDGEVSNKDAKHAVIRRDANGDLV